MKRRKGKRGKRTRREGLMGRACQRETATGIKVRKENKMDRGQKTRKKIA